MRDGKREMGMPARRRSDWWTRSCMGLVLGVVGAFALLAAPAAAAPLRGDRSASAFWVVGDDQQTRVSVQAGTAEAGQDPGSLFLFVTQAFCDTATDEMVFRSFSSQEALRPGDFRVHPLLKSARLDVTTEVSGTEQRLPGCTSPTGFPSFTDLGKSTVEVHATWTATGEVVEVQPGVVARDAVATGTITGEMLSPGPLGSSQFAQLRASTL